MKNCFWFINFREFISPVNIWMQMKKFGLCFLIFWDVPKLFWILWNIHWLLALTKRNSYTNEAPTKRDSCTNEATTKWNSCTNEATTKRNTNELHNLLWLEIPLIAKSLHGVEQLISEEKITANRIYICHFARRIILFYHLMEGI